MHNFSHVCQHVCICIVAEEDSSTRLCGEESDGAEAREGRSLAVYYSQLGSSGVAEDGEKRSDAGLPGALTLPPIALFPPALTEGTSHLGTGEIPLIQFPVEFNNPLKLFLFTLRQYISIVLCHQERQSSSEAN